MALTPQQLAELQRLKEMYAPLVEAQRRKDQAQANAEKMNVVPPGKADGGSIPSHDVMRLAIGGQGPKNWLKGSLDPVLQPLKQQYPDIVAPGIGETDEVIRARHPHVGAINQWIERNLANYIKKQMATHDDPIRRLAEQGILHIAPEQVGMIRNKAPHHRRMHGGEQLGQSPEAQAWEDAADVAMGVHKLNKLHQSFREPWMEKADPETKVFYPTDSMHAHYLGFDHIVDVLKQDLAEGRIRPEQLSKVSIEHAVRRTHEYDQERKKAMAETALKATEGMPVHKEYPEGYKWIELTLPELEQGYTKAPSGAYVSPEGEQSIHHPGYGKLEDALKYEGDTMGHCVGGYCPDVAAGKTRIFSLRDAKNEPHVTIEVKPNQHLDFNTWWDKQPKELRDEINARARRGEHRGSVFEAPEYLAARAALPPVIKQIKGKQNAKPKKQYIPYVQDFVKSGKWSDVGDIHNAEMAPIGEGKYVGENEAKKHFEPRIKKAVDFLQNHPAFKEQHAAKSKRDKDFLDIDYEEQRKLESVYGQPLYPKSYYSAPELLSIIKNPEDNIGSLNDYYPSLNDWLNEAEKGMAHHGYKIQQKADGGEVDAETVFMAKGGLSRFLKGSKETKKMYHATFGNIKKFDPNAPKLTDQGTGAYFFTPSVDFANAHVRTYGYDENEPLDQMEYGKGANIMPVVVHTKNPWDYENPKHVKALHKALAAHPDIGPEFATSKDRLASGDWSAIEDPAVQEAIKKLGHDAFYTEEGGVKNIGIYNRRNVKSIHGNRGTYDRRSSDITKSNGGEVDAESMFFPKTKE